MHCVQSPSATRQQRSPRISFRQRDGAMAMLHVFNEADTFCDVTPTVNGGRSFSAWIGRLRRRGIV